MKKQISFISTFIGTLTAVGVLWALPAVVSLIPGQQFDSGTVYGEEKKKPRKVSPLTEKVYKAISEAQALIDPESIVVEEGEERPDIVANPQQAILDLMETLERRRINSYEKAQVWNTLAFAYYTLDDTPNTLRAYENVLKEEITEALELSSLRALFQLYYAQEDYQKSINYMERWEVLKGVRDTTVTFIKATAYYQLNNFEKSLENVLLVEQIAIAEETTVKENWLYLQVVVYNELKDLDNVINVLEKLLKAYPKKQYWMHLAGMYAEKEMEDRSLSAYYAAYSQGMFDKESEVVMLSQRLLNAEVPFEAARILQKGFDEGLVEKNEKNIKLLAMSYTMSQDMDQAINAWEEATKFADDGELHYRLAQALANQDRHKEATTSYREAIKRGGLKDGQDSDASFWMGISLMQLKKWDDATDAFKEASKDKDRAKSAKQYIAYIRGEKRRLAALKEMLEAD
ncbi:MAG: tetratricopeptide (TPR) repeat protein [Candidatus Azotimanducaceae bacterium]|jgi:tetratricopeptide (TPR) repeat protein